MTVSEPRIPTTPHVHECGIEGGTHRLCFCVVCNESYPNKKFVERAEPSRGAPVTALGTCRTPHFLGEPTPDRKALTQIPHQELPQGLCREWQAIDRVAATKEPQSKGQDGSTDFMQTNTAPVYMCPAGCGCLWRDNQDGTMSLYGPNSKSCEKCEYMPLKELIPLERASGHVVLLEALRRLVKAVYEDYRCLCDPCLDSENNLIHAPLCPVAEAEAAIQQAERT